MTRLGNIVVRLHPFDSSEARYLIPLLEADLASMYPDWDDLVHPGMHHENNPRPPPALTEPKPEKGLSNAAQGDYSKSEPSKLSVLTEQTENSRPTIIFFVAFQAGEDKQDSPPNGRAVGCAALRLFSSLPSELDSNTKCAEIKRMFVVQTHRGQGISRLLIQELEAYARDILQLDSVVLEVGLRQVAAVSLYRTSGYVDRPLFGEYVGSGIQDGGESICLEKQLRTK